MASASGLQKLLLVLLIASLIAPEIHGDVVLESAINNNNNNNNTNNYIKNQREFDYFVLALQWPGTYCRKTRHCCSSNACCRGRLNKSNNNQLSLGRGPLFYSENVDLDAFFVNKSNAPTEFTIHGLWPDYNDGSWPACCTSSSFDMKEVATLLDPLQKYWPSLSCGSPSTCHGKKGVFWAHEWEKHGTCSSPVVHNEYEYFLTTLNVYFKHNVTKVLNDAGYVASNSEKYPLGGIITEIQNAFHATPLLACSNGAVQELKLCFYKDFTPRDCATSSSTQGDKLYSKSSCPKYVSLPEITSLGHENVEDADSWLPHSAAL